MLKLLSAVVAAAGIAGALTLLPGATSARLSASPPAKSEQVPLETCADRPWPYLKCSWFAVRRIEPATIDHRPFYA